MSRHPRPVAGRRNPPIEYPSHVPTRYDPKDARVTYGQIFGWTAFVVIGSAFTFALLFLLRGSVF